MGLWDRGHTHVWDKGLIEETEIERIVTHRCTVDGCRDVVCSYERLRVTW